jgi:cytochrome P450
MALPPGPSLPALVQTVLFVLRPVDFLEWCRKRYGGIFTVDTLIFGREVEIADPEMIKQALTADPDVARAGEANEIMAPLLGQRSVLLLDGPEHLRQRRLMMPPFHGEHVLAYAATMRSITEREIARWPVGEPFALHAHMQRITLDIILRTVFGVDEGAQLEDLRDALTRVLDRQADPIQAISQIPKLRRSFLGLTPWDGFLRDVKRADALIYRQIARRRADAAAGGKRRDDVLAMLLEARDEQGQPMTDVELRDELVTLLAAGHETTATMLCWAFDLVLGDARVRAALLRELDEAGAGAREPDLASIGRLRYLDATIKEVLRLRPVIPGVARRLKAPVVIGGHEIPAGELLVPVAWLAHHDPKAYERPEAFEPERFLDTKPDPYAWLPFGGGARRCLGMTFALYEMKVVLATVLTRVRLRKRHAAPARVKLRGFTFVPEGGTEVVVEARLDATTPRPVAPREQARTA